jgi:hypothetical protein
MSGEHIRLLRAAILQKRNMPVDKQWEDMVNRGVIDEQGNVMLPSMEPPPWAFEPVPETKTINSQ